MASFAENECLSLEGNHPLDPFWFRPSWVFIEFSHGLYMMDFYLLVIPTEFTELCKEALYKFCSIAVELGWVILQGCLHIP